MVGDFVVATPLAELENGEGACTSLHSGQKRWPNHAESCEKTFTEKRYLKGAGKVPETVPCPGTATVGL